MRRVERLLACMVLCCMIVCGEDVELKQDLGVKNQGELATATATVPGKMTSADVKNYDGWNGWKGGIASENSAEFNATVPDGFSGVHKPSFGGWFADGGGKNGGTGNGGLKSWKLDATVRSYDIALDSVEHADYIGDLADGQKVYCTSQKANDYVTIKLKTIPQNVTLPEGIVKWEGGDSGSNHLERKVKRSELIENGLSITASVGNVAKTRIKIYVFPAKLEHIDVDLKLNVMRNDEIIGAREAFGLTLIDYLSNSGKGCRCPQYDCYIYYQDKTWKCVLKSVSYTIEWGLNESGLGRTNISPVTVAEISPFPLGKGMDNDTSESTRIQVAHDDFVPRPSTIPHAQSQVMNSKREYYWCRDLTKKHELFHISDWEEHARNALNEVNLVIASQISIPVTVDNLSIRVVKQQQELERNGGIYAIEQNVTNFFYVNMFTPDAEMRAYRDGAPYYQELADKLSSRHAN